MPSRPTTTDVLPSPAASAAEDAGGVTLIAPDSASPLFAQIKARLRQDIVDKRLLPGQKLPSEAAMQASFGVSRITVRRALDAMIASGLIVRRRGVGTFVADRPSGVRSVRCLAHHARHQSGRHPCTMRTYFTRTPSASSTTTFTCTPL